MTHLLIAGGTGLIGRALSESLIRDGNRVTVLTRSKQIAPAHEGVQMQQWDARSAQGWAHLIESTDIVINLAGENLAGSGLLPQRWSAKQKQRIRQSRLQAGNALTQAILAAKQVPKVIIQASGVGYYGPLSEQTATENQPPGNDFLAKLAVDWENSTVEVERRGVRRVIIRTGAVLSTEGGALPRLLLPYRLFIGGPLGNGRQYLPWIHIDDEIDAIRFLIDTDSASGAYNLVAPNPLTNSEFGKVMGRILHRPSLFPTPAFVLKILLGEVSNLVLEGQRAAPERLLKLGYTFKFSEAETALRDLVYK